MVNTIDRSSSNLTAIRLLLRCYLVLVVATLAALAVLATVAPRQAPAAAWIHAIIVAAFAVLLLVRARSASTGSTGSTGSIGALRAVGLISAALLIVNVVEARIPGLVPIWMRVEMIGIAVLMAAVILCVVRERV